MTDEKVDLLLARYFSGEASEKELAQLDSWLAESEDHEDYFNRMTSLYQQTGLEAPILHTDTENALSQFKDYMQQEEQPVHKNIKFKNKLLYGMVAASIALLVGVFTFVYLNKSEEPILLVAESEDVKYNLNENMELLLMPSSQIRYNGKKKNEVELLQGEVTFTVLPGTRDKLLVQVGEAYIKDIGTIFTITAYNPAEYIQVEVTEGEVIFYTSDNTGITLKAGEEGAYDPSTGQFTYLVQQKDIIQEEMETTEVVETLSLLPQEKQPEVAEEIFQNNEKTSQEVLIKESSGMEFNALYLEDVAKELERQYGIVIIFSDKDIRYVQITATFEKDEPIENIMQVIIETLSLNISKNENTFIISR